MSNITKEREEMYKTYINTSLIIAGILTFLMMMAVWGAIDGEQYRGACGAAAVFLGSALVLVIVLQGIWILRRELEHRFGQIK